MRVDFQPSPAAWRYAHRGFEGEPPWKELARFDTASSTIHTYPIRTAQSFSVLSPRYALLNEIAFEGFLTETPLSSDGIEEALQYLPREF